MALLYLPLATLPPPTPAAAHTDDHHDQDDDDLLATGHDRRQRTGEEALPGGRAGAEQQAGGGGGQQPLRLRGVLRYCLQYEERDQDTSNSSSDDDEEEEDDERRVVSWAEERLLEAVARVLTGAITVLDAAVANKVGQAALAPPPCMPSLPGSASLTLPAWVCVCVAASACMPRL